MAVTIAETGAAITAAWTSISAATTVTVGTTSINLAAVALQTAVAYGASALATSLMGKPSAPGPKQKEITRQTVGPRYKYYGECGRGGTLALLA